MPSLRDDIVRQQTIRRLERLTPATKPQWGRLDAPRVLCHLSDTLAMALGDVPVKSVNRKTLQHFPLKHLFIYLLPLPKNAPTAPELLATAPGDFEADRRRVIELMNRLAATPKAQGPVHAFFGAMTNDQWNAQQWRHLDHHLRQFGC